MQSPYNEYGGKDFQDDPTRNYFSYEEGYRIKSTPEQDAIIRKKFIEIANTRYNLFTNNCAHAVQKSMFEAGLPVADPKYVERLTFPSTFKDMSFFDWSPNYHMFPGEAFRSIMRLNPGGNLYRK